MRLGDLSRATALHAAVDDLRGHAEARNQTIRLIVIVRLPGAVDNLQHARFWRLRVGEEEDRGSKVQPGVRHQLRFVQQYADVAVHRFRERAVVVVKGELFRTATKVANEIAIFVFTARPGLTLPDIRVTFAVIAALLTFAPAHLTHVNQRLTPLGFRTPGLVAAGFLREVREHGRQRLTADGIAVTTIGIGLAQCREFTDRFQEVAVGIFRRTQWEEIFPVAGLDNPFHALDVFRVCRFTRLNLFHQAVVQRADG